MFFSFGVTVYAQPAGEIHAIAFEQEENIYEVIIRGQGTLRYSAAFLENPERIQLWFSNTEARKIQGAVEPDQNEFVQRVLVWATPDDATTKITVDLKAKFQYAIEAIRDGIVLRLFHKTDSSEPAGGNGVGSYSSAVSNPDDLVIGPEDLLEINVFQLPEFSLTTKVLGDGTITMPLLGAIPLAGLSRSQAEQKISQELTKKQVNNPSVSIIVKEQKSRQVSVLGAVKNPGVYYLTSDRTLLQLLSEAGGLSQDAGTICHIFRSGSKLVIDLHDLLQNGNQELNIGINSGDVINVPQQIRHFVYVLGAVRSPGAVEILPNVELTLTAAIARAGGPTRLANLSEVQIKRKESDGIERVLKINVKDILNNKTSDIRLLPDDLINVPESFF
jgi:polysaccharide export outer membrane protein